MSDFGYVVVIGLVCLSVVNSDLPELSVVRNELCYVFVRDLALESVRAICRVRVIRVKPEKPPCYNFLGDFVLTETLSCLSNVLLSRHYCLF